MKHFLVAFLTAFTLFAQGQIIKPTVWTVEKSTNKANIGDVFEITYNCKIKTGWYIYSTVFEAEEPTHTVFTFKPNPTYALVGKPKPIGFHEKFDEVWGAKVSIAENEAKFIQKVKILKTNPVVSGDFVFGVCNNESGQCLPPETIEFKIEGIEVSQTSPTSAPENLAPTSVPVLSKDTSAAVAPSPKSETQPVATEIPTAAQPAQSLWSFLLTAFLAGLASIFMPCIYPIMPMTVSFFTKQTNGAAKALFYGLSIMVIFGLIGFVAMIFGADFLNFISTHWLPNLLFFFVFIFFGVSLLGGFEIVLPHNVVNNIDQLSDKGGLVGLFFMALTLVVVSFSCTVPFVGSLLILAAQGEVMRPLYGMLAFGLPFALVFTSLAIFPQWLKNLPKSGGWLGEVKVVFGFLEFALALKFLSNIDLTYHWNLLSRNTFLVLWIIAFSIIGLYILGFMRLPKDAKVAKITLPRAGFAAVAFGFVLYMIPAVSGRPAPLLSGILPPMGYGYVGASATSQPTNPKLRTLQYGLEGFYEYEDALAHAKTVNKPVLIDFTGYACANCRKMEDNVWPDEAVLKKLKNDFVIASLYVDDKKELDAVRHYTSTYDGKLKTTVGAKNADFQITKFNNNAQPYYCAVGLDGKLLTAKPMGYTTVEEFLVFLDNAKSTFETKL